MAPNCEAWPATKIQDLSSYITVGFVGSMSSLFVEEGVPLLRGQNIRPYLLDLTNLKYISPETHRKWKKSALVPGDVAIVRVGYPGTACVIPKGIGDLNAASLVIVRPNPRLLDSKFLCYVLNSEWGKGQIRGRLVGAAQQVFNTHTAADLEIPAPPLSVQRRIAGILSAYDELMENCQRRIRILEEMARALYREWFVHFRFPGHEQIPLVDSPLGATPQDWQVKPLFDLAEVKYGKTLPTKNLSEDAPYPVYGAAKIIGRYTEYTRERRTIICGCRGSVGEMQISLPQCFVTNNSFTFDPCYPDNFFWLFHSLGERGLHDVIGGAAQPQITLDCISSVELLASPLPLRSKFQQAVAPFFEQAWTLDLKVQNLRRTRDLLLPRLLSGQVPLDVSEDLAEPTTSAPPPAETDFASEEPDLRVAEEAPPWQVERAGNSHPSPAQHADETPMPIHQTERTDVLQIIRQVFSEGPPRPRDDAIRDVARALGYRRTGARIQEVLHGDLLTAARRGILENIDGTLRLCARSITDLDRDFLKQQFLAAIGRPWIDRDTATRDFCRWLGFARTGPVIEDTARSLINGLLREGRLEADGAEMIRRA